MTAEVVDLQGVRQERSPHISGPCKCLACSERWVGVAPVGAVHLECPQCGSDRGIFLGEFIPKAGKLWFCNCGCDVFALTPTEIMCLGCGLGVQGWP